MQDPSAVEVLEARDDLPEVISDLRFGERVPRFPNVCQRLWRRSIEQNVSPHRPGGRCHAAHIRVNAAI